MVKAIMQEEVFPPQREERRRDYNRDRRDNRDYRGPRRDRDFHKEGRNEKKENKDAE